MTAPCSTGLATTACVLTLVRSLRPCVSGGVHRSKSPLDIRRQEAHTAHMTQRTDLLPQFVGTFHVADDPGVAINGYDRVVAVDGHAGVVSHVERAHELGEEIGALRHVSSMRLLAADVKRRLTAVH